MAQSGGPSRFDLSLCKQSGHRRRRITAREYVRREHALVHAQMTAQQALERGTQIGGGLSGERRRFPVIEVEWTL